MYCYGIRRAGRDALSAAIAGCRIDFRQGSATGQQSESNGAGIAVVTAGPAYHAFYRQAVIVDAHDMLPCLVDIGAQALQCAGLTGLQALGAIRAACLNEARLWIVVLGLFKKVFRAGVYTVVAAGAALEEQLLCDGPGWAHPMHQFGEIAL